MARFCTHFEFFSSNRSQMLPSILSPKERGKYVENFGQHVLAWISSTWTKNNAEKATCTRFHTHRVSRVHSRAFRREQTTQVLQSFCDHVPRALQMFPFNQPALRASFYLLRFRFCPRFAQILSQQSLEPLLTPQSFSKERKELL